MMKMSGWVSGTDCIVWEIGVVLTDSSRIFIGGSGVGMASVAESDLGEVSSVVSLTLCKVPE